MCLTNQETQTESDTSSELACTATQTDAELFSIYSRRYYTEFQKKNYKHQWLIVWVDLVMISTIKSLVTQKKLWINSAKNNDLSRDLAAACKALKESEQRLLPNTICDGSCNLSVSRGNVIKTKNSSIEQLTRELTDMMSQLESEKKKRAQQSREIIDLEESINSDNPVSFLDIWWP